MKAPEKPTSGVVYLREFTSRKVNEPGNIPDSLEWWMGQYLDLIISGVRPEHVTRKITLHLGRFLACFQEAYGHDRVSACLRRDVTGWQQSLVAAGLAPATVNNHLASLSGCTTWIHAQAPGLFPAGDPAKGVGELGLPPLEPRTLSDDQVRSLKNICDRFHQLRARDLSPAGARLHAHARPWRDRAIVFILLSTGLRREELVRLDLDQVVPNTPSDLRAARKAQNVRVRGKGKSQRHVFLTADARAALADYLERERPKEEADERTPALFLSAAGIPARQPDGRLSPRSINAILEQIGKWHDAEQKDPARMISPLRPHNLRHTFGVLLSRATGADAYELERRLGHRSQRYIARYTNPPADVAARYVEQF